MLLFTAAAAAAKSLQSCPTLCDPTDGSPPGSPVPGILQARTLEWVAISFSNAWKWRVKVKSLGHVRLLVTLWTATHQAPPSMGFSRQEYRSGVPLPSPALIHYLRLKYPVGLPKSMQAKVKLLTPPDEVHDITEYELNNDRAHSVCFQLVNLQLKMDFHIEMLL